MGQIVPRRALLGALGGVLVASLATLLAWSSLASAERPAVAPEVHIPTAVASLDAKGGELAHLGATLRVPAGALRAPETLAMASAPLPGPLPRGFRAASPVVRLTKTHEGERFERPVRVTVAVDARARLDESVAVFWDVENRIYRTVTIVGRDDKARTITFETIHFTDFLVTSPEDDDFANPSAPLMAVDTGFRSARDGFSFVNGDYDSGGTCLGMSLLSAWYYETHKNDDPKAPSLRELMNGFDPVTPTADLVGREMALLAQRAAIPEGEYLARASKEALAQAARQGPITSGVALWDQIRLTGTPQLLVIQGPRGAHAIVVTGYRDGAFQIYDPNYPDETHTLQFDRVNGWGRWTGTPLGQPMDIAPVSYSSYAAEVDFEAIFERALANRGETGRYREITIDSARSNDGELTLRGHTSGGLAKPRDQVDSVALYVGNRIIAHGTIDRDGRFRLTASIAEISEAARSERAAPALVLGQAWNFAGAARVPFTAPSETPGAVGALRGR